MGFTPKVLLRDINFGKSGLNYFGYHILHVSSDFQLIFHAWCFHQSEKRPQTG